MQIFQWLYITLENVWKEAPCMFSFQNFRIMSNLITSLDTAIDKWQSQARMWYQCDGFWEQ